MTAEEFEREAESCDLRPIARRTITATEDHVGSVVVILGV
jgi:hypothetical protein